MVTKPDPESEAARSGEDADRNRDKLVKEAEERLEDAHGKKPSDKSKEL